MSMDSGSSAAISWWRQRLAGLFGMTHGGLRDTYEEFGWPQNVSAQMLMLQYLRNPVASRIIRAFPQATWRERPVIRDEAGDSSKQVDDNGKKNESFSPFVRDVENFLEANRAFYYLEQLDRLSSIGQFGILLMGFQDGAPLKTPLQASSRRKLTYLSVYSELNATITRWDSDPMSPRFGLPVMYRLRAGSLVAGQQQGVGTFEVHHSRVLHVAEFLDENEVFGTPRLLPVYNFLTDLEKVLGSSAETFWLNARGGMALTADKDATISAEALADMKEQAEEFEHQMRRILALRGIEAKMLSTNVADPGPNVEKLLDVIAGGVGMPKRILVGSERGELSSSQDDDNWAKRIDERQQNFAYPRIVHPFINLMISTGNIPQPKGTWWVDWSDSSALSPTAMAEISLKKSQALAVYSSSAMAEQVVPVEEFRTDFLGLEPTSEYTQVEEPIDETDENVIDQGMPDPLLLGDGTVPAAGDAAAADTALNGAQIASLKDIVLAVGTGDLEPESAVQLILVGFPTVTEELARAIIDPMAKAFADAEAEKAKNPPPDVPPPLPGVKVPPSEDMVQAQTVRAARMIGNHLITNARPRTLYVFRRLINAEDVRNHYRAQGFDKMVPAEEMHVTITYSKKRVDWMKMGTSWNDYKNDGTGQLRVSAGGARINEVLGLKKDVLSLLFSSSDLSWRHEEMCHAGASWDWPGYDPHVTITYNWDPADSTDNLVPYTGELVFGPEIFEELSDDWSESLKENVR